MIWTPGSPSPRGSESLIRTCCCHGEKGKRQGWLRGRGIPPSWQQCRIQLHSWRPASAKPTLPKGKGHLPRGKARAKAARAMGRAQNAGRKSRNPSQRGHTNHGGDKMGGLSSLQLDHTQCLQVLWTDSAPGGLRLPPPQLPHLAYPTPVWQKASPAKPTKKRTKPS